MDSFLDTLDKYNLTHKQLAKIVQILQSYDYDSEIAQKLILDVITKRVSINAVNGLTDIVPIQKIINQPWLYKKHYLSFAFDDVILDDSIKATDTFGTLYPAAYRWLYSISKTNEKSTVYSSSPLENIVGMRLSPISIAGSSLSPFSLHNATILISEFATQSFSTSGRRYHFSGDIALADDILVSGWDGVVIDTTDYNRGYYWFHTPIKSVNSFTFTFTLSTPITKYIVIPIVTAPVYFIPGRETLFFLPYNPAYYTTNIYYFTKFTTSTPSPDALIIDQVNRRSGYTLGHYPASPSALRVAASLNTAQLTNLHQYLPYTDQVWDGVTPSLVTDGVLLNTQYTMMYSNPVRIRTAAPHGITTGTTVFITDFLARTATGPTLYGTVSFENAVNDVAGHSVTVIDANTFSIPLDGTEISYRAVMYHLYTVVVNDYTQHLYLTSATLANITINPVMQLEVITMKE